MKVPFFRHSLSSDSTEAVARVLESPFLTTGPQSAKVEEQLRAYFSVKHAKLTSSWTQGAVATLLALDIGPGDEVIVPAMTFVATANVVKQVGATPIFVDVDPRTLLIDIEKVKEVTTANTRAIIPVHLYGQMVDVGVLREAVGPDIVIIEDAAHCFEGTRGGRRPGQDGDVAIFSFYATKNVTCGEGGAVITNNSTIAETLTQTALHGMTAGAAARFEGGRYNHWDVARLGVKANLPDLLAAFLIPQIATVETRREERAKLAARYEQRLAHTPFAFPHLDNDVVSAYHLFPIQVPEGGRDLALQMLHAREIGATVNYRSVPSLSYYRIQSQVIGNRYPISEAWGNATLSLPLFPGLGEDEQDYVLGVLEAEILPSLFSGKSNRRRAVYE